MIGHEGLSRRDLVAGLGGAAFLGCGPADAAASSLALARGGGDPAQRVDPGLRPSLEGWSPPIIDRHSLAALRRQSGGAAERLKSPIAIEQTIAGLPGQPPVSIIVIYPPRARGYRPAILHLHGGGFILGNADMAVRRFQDVVRTHDCLAVLVNYRLAPETPFPGAVEDSYAALRWLHASAADLGVDPARISVVGESAGAGLAAMLCLTARDRNGPTIAHQVLNYPMLDDRTAVTRAVSPTLGRYVWTRGNNRFAWTSFLGVPAGSRHVPEGAVPARARSLAGLPPAFIGVGSLDLFLPEDVDYAHRLRRAGVPTELVIVPGAFHGFDLIAPDTTVARAFRQRWDGVLDRALRGA